MSASPYPLDDHSIAMLVTDGSEQRESTAPRDALEAAGATVDVVALRNGHVRGWIHDRWGDTFEVSGHARSSDPGAFDALVLPGGVLNPDQLRMDEHAVRFVRGFFAAG